MWFTTYCDFMDVFSLKLLKEFVTLSSFKKIIYKQDNSLLKDVFRKSELSLLADVWMVNRLSCVSRA